MDARSQTGAGRGACLTVGPADATNGAVQCRVGGGMGHPTPLSQSETRMLPLIPTSTPVVTRSRGTYGIRILLSLRLPCPPL
eukprot:IDg5498t1